MSSNIDEALGLLEKVSFRVRLDKVRASGLKAPYAPSLYSLS